MAAQIFLNPTVLYVLDTGCNDNLHKYKLLHYYPM